MAHPNHPTRSQRPLRSLLLLGAFLLSILGAPAFAAEARKSFDVPAGEAGAALKQFAQQAGQQVLFAAYDVKGVKTPAVKGDYTLREGLDRLLAATDLVAAFDDKSATFSVRKETEAERKNASRATPKTESVRPEAKTATEEAALELPVFEVTGSQIRRDVADDTPSFMLDISRDEIERSGRGTLAEYLQTLPQNFGSATISGSDTAGLTPNPGGASAPSLRGLGAGATLTLINGRRLPSAGGSLGFVVDISLIPVSAIERVEILPDSASAIYGSDAVAGVVNVRLRRQFSGVEVSGSYGAATQGGYDQWRASVVAGTSWKGGSLIVGLERSNDSLLANRERDYAASDDRSTRGGTDGRSTNTSPGNIVRFIPTPPAGLTTPLAIPSGQNGTNLTVASLLSQVGLPQNRFSATGFYGTLLPKQERQSVFWNLRQDLGKIFTAHLDGYWGQRESYRESPPAAQTSVVPATNAFNTFGRLVQVQYSFNELGPVISTLKAPAYTVTGTLEARLGQWRHQASYSFAADRTEIGSLNNLDLNRYNAALANSDPTQAVNLFGNGTGNSAAVLNNLRFSRPSGRNTDLDVFRYVADGPAFALPGGDLRTAFGAEYRKESYDFYSTSFSSGQPDITGAVIRKAKAVFGELLLPVFGPQNARSGLRRLEVSLAGRTEDYDDTGRANTPKVGVAWEPVAGFLFRGTYGRSFQAPSIEYSRIDAAAVGSQFVPAFPDAARNGELAAFDLITGGGRALRPQKAESWTYGVVFQPKALEGRLRAGLNYFKIDYVDRVASFGLDEMTGDPVTYADFQTRAALTPADQAAGLRFGRLLTLDVRSANASQTNVAGWDAQVEYRFPKTSVGQFSTALNATFYDRYRQKVTAGGATIERKGVLGYPTDHAFSWNVNWSSGAWSANAVFRRTDEYRDTNARTDSGIVEATTSLDLGAAYDFGSAGSGWTRGLRLSLNIVNIADKDPSFVNQAGAYDTNVGNPRGRMVSFSFRKAF